MIVGLELEPVSLREARRWIAQHHRHNDPPRGWKFGVAAALDGQRVGVGVASRPVARELDDGTTLEVTRVATDGTRNACSFLYAALARAAAALGYRRLVTYTLAEEPGSSLLACGWRRDAELPAREAWDYTGQYRQQRDLFGNDRRPPGPKVRWVRDLA